MALSFDDAKKVAAICSNCDSQCPECLRRLRDLLAVEFPEFLWKYEVPTDEDGSFNIEVFEVSQAIPA